MNKFSQFTDFVFEIADFIAELFEEFRNLGAWMVFRMPVTIQAFAEVLFCFVGFPVNAVRQIVQACLVEVFGCDMHVLNAMSLLVQFPFEIPMFFRMFPMAIPLVPLVVVARRVRGTLGTPLSVSIIGTRQE